MAHTQRGGGAVRGGAGVAVEGRPGGGAGGSSRSGCAWSGLAVGVAAVAVVWADGALLWAAAAGLHGVLLAAVALGALQEQGRRQLESSDAGRTELVREQLCAQARL